MLNEQGGAIIPVFKDWLDAHLDKVGGHTPHGGFDMDNGYIMQKAWLKSWPAIAHASGLKRARRGAGQAVAPRSAQPRGFAPFPAVGSTVRRVAGWLRPVAMTIGDGRLQERGWRKRDRRRVELVLQRLGLGRS